MPSKTPKRRDERPRRPTSLDGRLKRLESAMEKLEKDASIQFQRIAQIQAELDKLKKP